MATFDEFLRENILAADALDAPPVQPPERIRKRFEAALAEKFGQSPGVANQVSVEAEAQNAELLLLWLLREHPQLTEREIEFWVRALSKDTNVWSRLKKVDSSLAELSKLEEDAKILMQEMEHSMAEMDARMNGIFKEIEQQPEAEMAPMKRSAGDNLQNWSWQEFMAALRQMIEKGLILVEESGPELMKRHSLTPIGTRHLNALLASA